MKSGKAPVRVPCAAVAALRKRFQQARAVVICPQYTCAAVGTYVLNGTVPRSATATTPARQDVNIRCSSCCAIAAGRPTVVLIEAAEKTRDMLSVTDTGSDSDVETASPHIDVIREQEPQREAAPIGTREHQKSLTELVQKLFHRIELLEKRLRDKMWWKTQWRTKSRLSFIPRLLRYKTAKGARLILQHLHNPAMLEEK